MILKSPLPESSDHVPVVLSTKPETLQVSFERCTDQFCKLICKDKLRRVDLPHRVYLSNFNPSNSRGGGNTNLSQIHINLKF